MRLTRRYGRRRRSRRRSRRSILCSVRHRACVWRVDANFALHHQLESAQLSFQCENERLRALRFGWLLLRANVVNTLVF